MQTIVEIAKKYRTDKGTAHSYLPVYEQLFITLRESEIRLLEIGVLRSESLRLWRECFPNGRIEGLDVDPEFVDDDFTVHRFSQGNRSMIEKTWPDESLDVIIDDGSHKPSDQIMSLCWLWPKLKRGGIYCIEDVNDTGMLKYFEIFRPIVYDRSSVAGRKDDILVVLRK